MKRFDSNQSSTQKPISQRVKGNTPWGCLIPFSLIFGVVGAGILWFMFLVPVMGVMGAKNWPSVPCRIVSSKVHTSRDSDGTTYRPDISFSYSYKGQTHTSDSYSFGGKVSSGYNWAQGRVSQYPAGSNAICYVNPSYPQEAVIDRGFTGEVFFGLMGVPFLAFPLIMLIVAAKSRGGGKSRALPNAAWRPAVAPVISASPSGGMVLQNYGGTRTTKAIGLFCVAAFWNGIVSVFLFGFFRDEKGLSAILPGLFMIPFVLIGIGLIIAFFWQVGALFNPSVTVSLPRDSVQVGESLPFYWEIKGGMTRLNQIKITLEGREEATFRRGTDTITDKSPFFYEVIAEESSPVNRNGQAMISIPADTMHSFEASNNKILWILTFEAPVSKWPDVREEWKINVMPRESMGSTGRVDVNGGGQ